MSAFLAQQCSNGKWHQHQCSAFKCNRLTTSKHLLPSTWSSRNNTPKWWIFGIAFIKNATSRPLVFNINFIRRSKTSSEIGAEADSEIWLQRGTRAESDLLCFEPDRIRSRQFHTPSSSAIHVRFTHAGHKTDDVCWQLSVKIRLNKVKHEYICRLFWSLQYQVSKKLEQTVTSVSLVTSYRISCLNASYC